MPGVANAEAWEPLSSSRLWKSSVCVGEVGGNGRRGGNL